VIFTSERPVVRIEITSNLLIDIASGSKKEETLEEFRRKWKDRIALYYRYI